MRDPSRQLAGLSQLLRERPDGEALRSGFVNAVRITVFLRQRDPKADSSDAYKCLAFFKGTLGFSLFPHARCPQRAPSLGNHNRMLAWDWAASEIRTHVGDANRMHAASLDSIADTFLGNCRFPLYVTGEMLQGWRDSPKLINGQRTASHGWPFWDSGAEPVPVQPPIAFFRTIVRRNRSRSCRRYLRPRSFSLFRGCEVWEDERHLADPSDDADIPAALPGVHLDLPDYYSLPLA